MDKTKKLQRRRKQILRSLHEFQELQVTYTKIASLVHYVAYEMLNVHLQSIRD